MPYTINGQPGELLEPTLTDDTTFVPLAGITEMLGGYVTYDNFTKSVLIELGAHKARLQADDPSVEINGEMQELQAAPYIDESKMWIPVRFFEQLGCKINVSGDHVEISNL